ncbi:MAG: IS1634 family transposase [Clostridia bacterium]|nr:IS1634 family transposase [Clostridia bacterium]
MALKRLLADRQFAAPVERAIFAMVADRALAPSSKLAIEDWVENDVVIEGLPQAPVHQLYRAVDFLIENDEQIQESVFFSTANLFNLEVNLIYFDTGSTYFEVEPDAEDEEELRRLGHSKDHRPDLLQVVIGLAVTRDGIPVRCWVWPGNTNDMEVVAQVKKDMCGWKLGRVITVVDRGFSSADNLRHLQRAGGHYIAGERMRSGMESVEEALSRQGRYRTVKENLEIKEIVVGDGEARTRYVLARNPLEAERDRRNRECMLDILKERLRDLKCTEGEHHSKAVCELMASRRFGGLASPMADLSAATRIVCLRGVEDGQSTLHIRSSLWESP